MLSTFRECRYVLSPPSLEQLDASDETCSSALASSHLPQMFDRPANRRGRGVGEWRAGVAAKMRPLAVRAFVPAPSAPVSQPDACLLSRLTRVVGHGAVHARLRMALIAWGPWRTSMSGLTVASRLDAQLCAGMGRRHGLTDGVGTSEKAFCGCWRGSSSDNAARKSSPWPGRGRLRDIKKRIMLQGARWASS
jgi:hypothetical protein